MEPVLDIMLDWELLDTVEETAKMPVDPCPSAPIASHGAEEPDTSSARKLEKEPTSPEVRPPLQAPDTRPSPPLPTANQDGPHLPDIPIYLPVNRYDLCWRCGYPGHSRFHCDAPSRIFCSRCGLCGIMSRSCPCRLDNYRATRPSRTHHHHLRNQTSRGVQCGPCFPGICSDVATQWEDQE